jgi:hypothetical protein
MLIDRFITNKIKNMSNMETNIAFISGHIDLTQEEFDQYYKNKIDEAITKKHSFVIGDARGADALAQEYLINLIPKEKVKIYHMFDKPLVNKDNYKTVGGFKNHNKKDTAMTLGSDYDIAYVRSAELTKKILEKKGILYNPKRKSGTQRNLDRREKLKPI